MPDQTLAQKYETLIEYDNIDVSVPLYITENLHEKFELREYQEEAISCFLHHYDYPRRQKPTQLLFNMATGSGKTLIMAACILHLYKKGYRNFIFFVNSTNIIEKTKENFLNPNSSKYLFSRKIVLDNKDVDVKEVENFEAVSEDDINIHFTTIQKLHSALNTPQEDSVTYEDFQDKEIVLLSDEAHHINTLTKSKSSLTPAEQREYNSWEKTVNRIFESNIENILLEFTATVELSHPEVREKYKDKILYKYPLKQFRKDKFSKEVNVLRADLSPWKRALQAIILSQYRRKVAEKYGKSIKPVVLMKSNYVNRTPNVDPDSDVVSGEFREKFHDNLSSLTVEDIEEIRANATGVVEKAFEYFDENNITTENFIRELQEDFSEEKSLTVDTQAQSEEYQILVNSLEDDDNPIRVIFAVDKLNEGWDVLNLFDIVRLYDTRDARHGKPGKKTIREAQLIGRGARYYPFKVSEEQDRFKRKYDQNSDHELRILEELYYHSANNSRYIQELKTALVDTGIMPPDDKKKERQLKVKEYVKETPFWKDGVIFLNNRVPNKQKDVSSFEDAEIKTTFHHKLHTGYSQDIGIFGSRELQEDEDKKSKVYQLIEFRESILDKALQVVDFYKFSNLLNYFPDLSSMTEFKSSDDFLPNIRVEVSALTSQHENLTAQQKLDICVSALSELSKEIKNKTPQYKGTKEFEPQPISECVEDKTMKISLDERSDQEYGRPMAEAQTTALRMNLEEKDWYVYDENYGTSEEKYFTKFMNDTMDKLQEKYTDIFLIRNANLFQIYRFSDGAAFEPDFVLFMKEKETDEQVLYQLFVEPKGQHLRDKDEWKEEFLSEIEDEYELYTLHDDSRYRLKGMPFYTEQLKSDFEEEFRETLDIESLY